MENFCWEWEVLRQMTRHVDTGSPIPKTLFDRMLAAKNFQSGLDTLRQIEFAVFDMRLHSDFDPGAGHSALQLLEEVRERVAVLKPRRTTAFRTASGTFSAAATRPAITATSGRKCCPRMPIASS